MKNVKEEIEATSQIVESLFWDVCTVMTTKEKESIWGETILEFINTEQDLPCHLSYESKSSVREGELLPDAKWQAMLFYPSYGQIPAGSRVDVLTKKGQIMSFWAAGEAVCYGSHNEICLQSCMDI